MPRPPVTLADAEAGYRPDCVVVLVLVAPGPRNPLGAQLRVRHAWLDRDPAHRLVVEVADEAAGVHGVRLPAGGAGAVHGQPLLQRGVAPKPAADLEPLALAVEWVVGSAEDRLQVLPAGVVGGNDSQLAGRDRAGHPPILGSTGAADQPSMELRMNQPAETTGRYEPTLNARPDPPSGRSGPCVGSLNGTQFSFAFAR
jgi:hypothetical protein